MKMIVTVTATYEIEGADLDEFDDKLTSIEVYMEHSGSTGWNTEWDYTDDPPEPVGEDGLVNVGPVAGI